MLSKFLAFSLLLHFFQPIWLLQNPSHNDLELFVRIAESDESAFTQLFLAYTERLYPYVANLLNSELWAEEIIQDVFLKLWKNRHTLRDIDNPAAYLFRMAANRTLDHLKRHALEVKMQYHISRQSSHNGNNPTEEHLDFRISEHLLRAAVKSLPPQRQLVYKLKHEDGLSYEEIAGKLHISKHTVRNHIAEALQAIRTYLLKNAGILLFLIFYGHRR